MKQVYLKNDSWVYHDIGGLTPEERAALRNPATLIAQRKQLVERVIQPASEEESATAAGIFNQNFPEGAELLSASINLPSGHGVINCRVEGEHKQIRF